MVRLDGLAPLRYSYDAIRDKACQFLDNYCPSSRTPINIERIADVDLGINIVPVRGLTKDFGIDGGLSGDRCSLFIDDHTYRHNAVRCRFTIAHEIGHYFLHTHVYNRVSVLQKPEDILLLNSKILSDDDHRWYEWQANSFAGLILVPSKNLEQSIAKAMNQHSFIQRLEIPSRHQYLSEIIAPEYEVSHEVILYRGLYDKHWSRRVINDYYQKPLASNML